MKTPIENDLVWRSVSVGGDGGANFSDIGWPPASDDQLLLQAATPVEVRVRVGRYLDQIQMVWSSAELDAHGGKGADLESFSLNANECIVNVRLTMPSDRYIGSLELLTNQGRTALFGKQKGEIFDLKVPANYQVVGFYGRSGRWVDRLGLIAVPQPVFPDSVVSVESKTPEAFQAPAVPPEPETSPSPEMLESLTVSAVSDMPESDVSAGLSVLEVPDGPEPDGPVLRRPSDDVLSAIPRSGIELIKQFEGYAQELPDGRAQAYADPLYGWEVPTIGYGTTRYPNGTQVSEGDVITQVQAEDYLIEHINQSCRRTLEQIPTWARMNSNQQGALYSFAYNLGSGFYGGFNFDSITLVCDSPDRWTDHGWVTAQFVKYRNPGTSVEEGLRRRRLAEAELFCQRVTGATPNWDDDHDEAHEAGDRKPENRLYQSAQAVLGQQPVGDRLTPDMPFDMLITPHITYGEFAKYEEQRRFRHGYQCKTAYAICLFLEQCREHFGGNPLVITSGYRPLEINAAIGGARRSEHLYDAVDTGAVDFYIKRVSVYEVETWCDQYYPHSVGYGAARGFVHLGMRPGRPRVRWVY